MAPACAAVRERAPVQRRGRDVEAEPGHDEEVRDARERLEVRAVEQVRGELGPLAPGGQPRLVARHGDAGLAHIAQARGRRARVRGHRARCEGRSRERHRRGRGDDPPIDRSERVARARGAPGQHGDEGHPRDDHHLSSVDPAPRPQLPVRVGAHRKGSLRAHHRPYFHLDPHCLEPVEQQEPDPGRRGEDAATGCGRQRIPLRRERERRLGEDHDGHAAAGVAARAQRREHLPAGGALGHESQPHGALLARPLRRALAGHRADAAEERARPLGRERALEEAQPEPRRLRGGARSVLARLLVRELRAVAVHRWRRGARCFAGPRAC